MVKQWPAHKTMSQSAHTNPPLFGHVRSGFLGSLTSHKHSLIATRFAGRMG